MGTGARDASAAGRSAAVRLRRTAARLLPDAASLRSSRDFRSLYGGQSVSFAGTMIAVVALPYQVYQLTGSALMVGLLSCAELVPLVTAAVLGGLLADAADRRRLILAAQVALIVASAALALNAARWRQVWVVFVLSAVSAGFAGLQRPSVEALVRRLVARADLPGAAALMSLTATPLRYWVRWRADRSSPRAACPLPTAWPLSAAFSACWRSPGWRLPRRCPAPAGPDPAGCGRGWPMSAVAPNCSAATSLMSAPCSSGRRSRCSLPTPRDLVARQCSA